MRAVAQRLARQAAGTSSPGASARLLATEARGSSAATQSSGLRRFFLALVPIGVIAATVEWVHSKEEQAAADVAAAQASAAAAGRPPPPKATIHGGTTVHGVPIDPSNPLHKVLPETDCEFCLESREKLWGMMKAMRPGGGGGSAAGSSSGGGGSVAGKVKAAAAGDGSSADGGGATAGAAAAPAVAAPAVAAPVEPAAR